jgi:hypothetical protein
VLSMFSISNPVMLQKHTMAALKEEDSLHLETVHSEKVGDVERSERPIHVSATEEALIRKKVWHYVSDSQAVA